MKTEKTILKVIAVLIALRALTNVGKPFGAGAGLVFFGKLLTDPFGIYVLAPLLGIYMLIYAYGIWTMRRFALPMGIAYALFVPFNVLLFPVFEEMSPAVSGWKYVVFGVLAIGVPALTVWLLARCKAELK